MEMIEVMREAGAPVVPVERPLEATLLLADGSRFTGVGLGAAATVSGEFVFTTAMTGYQEAITDPSYRGQILMFTYPLVGNYGMLDGTVQSATVQPSAVIAATLSENRSDRESLAAYLARHGVPAMHDVDTRAIARRIRAHGAMPAALSVYPAGDPCLAPVGRPTGCVLQAALDSCAYDTTDFVAETTIREPRLFGTGRRLIALLDCGNKRRVVDDLLHHDVQVAVLPAHTPASDILALRPDGVVISNGPGNPAAAGQIVETVRRLYSRLQRGTGGPALFGICLGHQLLALAAGARTYKLRFGHRGANHPVQECQSETTASPAGRSFITTQNHGFAVDESSLPRDLRVWYRNLNDGTVEGLRHESLPIRSVQFHPEGAPGPRDAGVLLGEWLREVA